MDPPNPQTPLCGFFLMFRLDNRGGDATHAERAGGKMS